MSTRVLLADDHEIMREGLCALLRKCPDVEVVGQAADGRTAVEMVKELEPDVAIIDISMPNLNGIEATRKMLVIHPSLKVMALSTHSSRAMVIKMLKAGAFGYMLKESAFTELIDEHCNACVVFDCGSDRSPTACDCTWEVCIFPFSS